MDKKKTPSNPPIEEQTLRPAKLSEFIGNSSIKERLSIIVEAASIRDVPVGHILFYGPPGLGKTTLASILAKEMGSRIVATSGPSIEKAGDLAGILTSLQPNDILFIDEIHSLSKTIEEYLYPAIEDFTIDFTLDSGTNARSVKVDIAPFTLVAATTKKGNLSAPLRSRFMHTFRLEPYSISSMIKIVERTAAILNFSLDSEGAEKIAFRSRGTPRIANNLTTWVADYAITKMGGIGTREAVDNALTMLQIDTHGLDEMDIKILTHILEYHDGGPIGLKTLSHSLGEDQTTLEEVYEPFLLKEGFLRRTPRGRETTEKARQHMLEKRNRKPL